MAKRRKSSNPSITKYFRQSDADASSDPTEVEEDVRSSSAHSERDTDSSSILTSEPRRM